MSILIDKGAVFHLLVLLLVDEGDVFSFIHLCPFLLIKVVFIYSPVLIIVDKGAVFLYSPVFIIVHKGAVFPLLTCAHYC